MTKFRIFCLATTVYLIILGGLGHSDKNLDIWPSLHI